MDILNCDTSASYIRSFINFIAEHCGCDAQSESTAPGQLGEIVESIALLYYNLSDADKMKVFLTAFGNQTNGDYRKDICAKLARFTNRREREIQGLADETKALLFVRHLAQFDITHPSIVVALAFETYRRWADQVIQSCPDVDAAVKTFRALQSKMPDVLWSFVLRLVVKRPDEQMQAIEAIDALVDRPVGFALPFGVGDLPPLTKIESYLLNLHKKDAAVAKPLIESLSQLIPSRPENWLIYGLTGVGLPAHALLERAWWLAGGLYSWGEDISKSSKPFPNPAIKDRGVLQAIYCDPKLAAARTMIGEYLIRQLVLVEEQPLLMEVLPSDMVSKYPRLLMGLVAREASDLARQKNLDQVKSLLVRFPLLREEGILAIAYRRADQYEAAAAELRNCKHMPPGERELIQARIANAFDFSLPSDPGEQRQMRDKLGPLLKTDGRADSEIGYCKCLVGILGGDPVAVNRRPALNAERSLFQAQDSLVQSDKVVTKNLISLYKALGGGLEKLEQPSPLAQGQTPKCDHCFRKEIKRILWH